MPIPTHAKSMSVMSTSTIPSRKPSTKESSRELVNQPISDDIQSNLNNNVSTPGCRPMRRPARTTSQIRPPNLHIRNVSTISLPTSTTRSAPKKSQPSSASSDIGTSQVRRRQAAVNASSQETDKNTRSNSKIQSEYDINGILARSTRVRQLPVTSANSTRPRSVISLASDLSITSSSNKNREDLIPETQKNELLQLSIIHLNSQQTLEEFERCMQQSLTRRSEKVANQEGSLLTLERQKQHIINSKALQTWLDTNHECTNAQKIQGLSTAIQNLNSYDLETRYTKALQTFQQWLDRVNKVRQHRMDQGQANKLRFVTSIGSQWQRCASEIEQNLSVIIAALADGKPGDETSGIAILVTQNFKLAKVMLQEIQTAATIEKSVMLLESDWEQAQINVAVKQTFESADPDVGIWAT